MNKLIKIAPLIVILACGGSLFMAFRIFQMKKSLIAEKDDAKNSLTTASNNLRSTQSRLDNSQKALAATSNELAQASKSLDDSKTALEKSAQEADGLKTQLAAQTKQLQASRTELATMQAETQKIGDAFRDMGIPNLANVQQIRERVQGMAEENKVLTGQLTKLRDDNKQLQDKIVELGATPVNTRGKVASVEDRWGFIVLNIGEEQNVRKHSQFLIYRDSRPVGVVEIVSVGPTTSVAEILPEYRRSMPRVGDIAVH